MHDNACRNDSLSPPLYQITALLVVCFVSDLEGCVVCLKGRIYSDRYRNISVIMI